jgi:hypothetical protein
MLLSALSFLAFGQPSSEVPDGLMNYSVFCYKVYWIGVLRRIIEYQKFTKGDRDVYIYIY